MGLVLGITDGDVVSIGIENFEFSINESGVRVRRLNTKKWSTYTADGSIVFRNVTMHIFKVHAASCSVSFVAERHLKIVRH